MTRLEFLKRWNETKPGESFVYFTGFLGLRRQIEPAAEEARRLGMPYGAWTETIAYLTQRRVAEDGYDYRITKAGAA